MKIFITGGGGLLGQYLNIVMSESDTILTTYRSNPGNCRYHNSIKCDLTNHKQLSAVIKGFAPDVVVHTAAVSRPETCDAMSMPEVLKINTGLTADIAGLCADTGSAMFFTSTDLVYDGNAGGMMKEDGKINPESRYAESKLLAEECLPGSGCSYVILRTSLLYGMGLNHSVNNFHNTLNNLRNGISSKLFYDQFRTPLSLIDASYLLKGLLSSGVKDTILNFGGRERVSRYELGEMLCDSGGYSKGLLERISMYDIDTAHKVADVSMDTGKLNTLVSGQLSISESIDEILKEGVSFRGRSNKIN